MHYIQAIITGIVQGLTEFLPVSSSAHLVLTAAIFDKILHISQMSDAEEIFFDLMLHLGTLIAVVFYFKNELDQIFKAFINALKTKDFQSDRNSKLPIFIAAGTLTSLCIAAPFKDVVEEMFKRPDLVGYFLITTACLLAFTEFYSQKITKNSVISTKKALLVGAFQGFAMIFRGISRSGSTMAAGLLGGLNRVDAARFSFLMSIPIIIIAVIFHSLELLSTGEMLSFSMGPIFVGTVISAIVGYLCIKYFLIFLQKHSFYYFSVYCAIIGFLAIKFF
ncbi:MAG: undecaprenyl-diphosphate phosphatase [Candidatus Gastranaerophilales bacterium]|nr:undecaprenyl-diphosphate phosphatase [Candidatus Gastranaerophilales bacterium]